MATHSDFVAVEAALEALPDLTTTALKEYVADLPYDEAADLQRVARWITELAGRRCSVIEQAFSRAADEISGSNIIREAGSRS